MDCKIIQDGIVYVSKFNKYCIDLEDIKGDIPKAGERILVINRFRPAFYIVKCQTGDRLFLDFEFQAIGFNPKPKYGPLRYTHCPCCDEPETLHPDEESHGYSCCECGTIFDYDLNPLRH